MQLPRPEWVSFRQLLLVAFVLIGVLLGGTALRAVATLDQLVAQSGAEAARALELTARAQTLAARTADMERAARQSLIFNDAVLRRRFEDEASSARDALQHIAAAGLPSSEIDRWLAQQQAVSALLLGPVETALERERTVAVAFREFDVLNAALAQRVQKTIEASNTELRQQLAASRARLMQQVVLAIGVAAALALALGVWLARPFKRLEGAIVGLGENRLHTPIDIRGPADVRRVGQQLEWLRLRLTELEADKARFLRHISHELKTPLAALHEGVALLDDGVAGELGTSQREVVRILQHNTATLQAQIEALLRFNAAAFEARQLRRERVDVLTLLHQQVQAQQLQWQARGLSVHVEGSACAVSADADKLGTAVANLLSNAIRFSPPRGTVRLLVQLLPGWVCIDIHDQGPGVAENDRQRIFEPFYRGERQPQDALRGTGIGLSLVQEYIAAHGGRVSLMPGDRGAHFRIELPHGF